jgi:two-component system nitrogen regulation response regulator GlnG
MITGFRVEPARQTSKARLGAGPILGKRILYVDDDEFLRRVAIRILGRAGAVCFTAGSHAQAIEIVYREPALALVILDFQMPDGDIGLLVDRLRAAHPDLPLIGNSGQDRAHDFAERGVAVFLEKPWKLETLQRAMNW